MNKKQFQVWKDQRKRDYLRDKQNLDETFATRGLAFSGGRKKAEEELESRYNSEIKIMENQVEAEEIEEERKNKERRILISANIILAIAAVVSIIFSTLTLSNLKDNTRAEFRPYVGIRNIELIVLSQGHFEARAFLENTGRVPANNVDIKTFQILEGGVPQLVIDETRREGLVLMPSETITKTLRVDYAGLDNLINSDEGWSLIWEAKYDGIITKNHTSSVKVKFDPTFKIFDVVYGFAN